MHNGRNPLYSLPVNLDRVSGKDIGLMGGNCFYAGIIDPARRQERILHQLGHLIGENAHIPFQLRQH